MGGISAWQILITITIVALLFGTNRLRSIGSDIGASIKAFRRAISDDDVKQDNNLQNTNMPDDSTDGRLSNFKLETNKNTHDRE